ncbi:MAG: phosphatidate cytidylyltransferase [Acidobacteriaceae bacterium]|nr:phosphatidate cytidylyltransferase [Acidobacteriaceae bacterium]
MKRVITAAVLIPMVLLLLLKGSFATIVAAAALVAELAAWEYLFIADCQGFRRTLVLIAIALLFAATFFSPALILPALGLCSLVLVLVCTFASPLERVLRDSAFSIFPLLYIGLSLATLPLLWVQADGPSLLIFLFCIVWAGDIAALYVGRNFGRHKLAPQISPNKSWEGSAASVVGSLLIAALLVSLARWLGSGTPLHFPGPLVRWLGLAVLLNVFAQVGDLVESAIKRGAGVKDSGAMLPGHGGILDRIDALLLAAPALWYAQWIQLYFERASLR